LAPRRRSRLAGWKLALVEILRRAQHAAMHELSDFLARQQAGVAAELPGAGRRRSPARSSRGGADGLRSEIGSSAP
jgi:hypothetical protein